MTLVREVLAIALWVFLLLLIARLILSWVQVLARDYRPHGVMLVIFEVVYSATDPFLKPLQRVIPPLPLGSVRLDLSFLVLFLATSLLLQIVAR